MVGKICLTVFVLIQIKNFCMGGQARLIFPWLPPIYIGKLCITYEQTLGYLKYDSRSCSKLFTYATVRIRGVNSKV